MQSFKNIIESYFASFPKHLLVKLRFKHILILISQYNVKTQDSQNGNMPQNKWPVRISNTSAKKVQKQIPINIYKFLNLIQ